MKKIIKNHIVILFFIALFVSCTREETKENSNLKNEATAESMTIGTKHTLTSKILKEDREIVVVLPKEYEEIDTYQYAVEVSKNNNYGQEETYQKEIDRLKGVQK